MSTINWKQARQLSVAPMLDWTDRHCRYLHRLLHPSALLYTEMIHANAIVFGDAARHLDFNAEEHPVALQLGGSEPALLQRAARIGAQWGYDEINLNCGCPSERVQSGSFGACLMRQPQEVVDCVRAMQDAVSVPVTIKHRTGLDDISDYAFVRDFVGKLVQADVRVFIVHARNAWLKGLSPKENREIPPLRYEVVHQLKRDFPEVHFTLNGGIQTVDAIQGQLQLVDGVMLGRWAYYEPYALFEVYQALHDGADAAPSLTRQAVVQQLVAYAQTQIQQGVPLRAMTRHWLNLFHGVAGARRWRAHLSDASMLAHNDAARMLAHLPQESS